MMLLADTSVWSLALRRDAPPASPEIQALKGALNDGAQVVTTGLVLQELLQGFSGPKEHKAIVERFSALPLVAPDRQDHVDAAALRNGCRRAGIQVGTIDAVLAQLCIRHELVLLTTDRDFAAIAKHAPLRVWGAAG
jgi:predicted nucleic acid-binding protein